MNSNNWRFDLNEAASPSFDGAEWRDQFLPDSRQRFVYKIMETLERALPFCDQEGLQELNQFARSYEERIYDTATSQSDYLRKISPMESTSQNLLLNDLPSGFLDSAAQTGGTSSGEWQEEVYQKIKHMKDMYFAELNEMYQKNICETAAE